MMGNVTGRFFLAVYGYLEGDYVIKIEAATQQFPAFHLTVIDHFHLGAFFFFPSLVFLLSLRWSSSPVVE